MGPAERARVPGGKDCLPLLELTEAENEGSGSSWSPTPSHSDVVTDLCHPCVGLTKVSDSLNVIIKKACKGMVDLVISGKADGEAFAVLAPYVAAKGNMLLGCWFCQKEQHPWV